MLFCLYLAASIIIILTMIDYINKYPALQYQSGSCSIAVGRRMEC